jgi:hypothetical protein
MDSTLDNIINYLKYLFEAKSPNYSWYTVIRCRFGGHNCGVVWYNAGYEPDMHCLGCDDDLG